MDAADTRRGAPCVHQQWDQSTAILAGDALLVRVYPQVVQAAPERAVQLVEVLSEAALLVCAGQMLDLELERAPQQAYEPAKYLEMIRLKTAVLIGAALQVGALGGGAQDEEALRWRRYGEALGLAFQLQDDYLDLYAPESPDQAGGFGKTRGGDILQDKLTLLWLHAWQNANQEQRQILLHWRGKEGPKADKLAAVEGVFQATDVQAAMQQRISELYAQAEAELEPLAQKPGVELVRALAEQISGRVR